MPEPDAAPRLARSKHEECTACDRICPVVGRMDVKPSELVAMVERGEKLRAAATGAIWECLDCRKCAVVCGSGIDVHSIINDLRATAYDRSIAAGRYAAFHRAFVEVVRKRGVFSPPALWRKIGLPRIPKGLLLYRLMKGKPPLWVRRRRRLGEDSQ